MKVDLIVLTHKPESTFVEMLERVSQQTMPVNKVIIYNTEQKYYERIVYSGKFFDEHKNIEAHHISRREYDCGKTRNLAVKSSDADYVVFMHQHALPYDNELIEKLIKALESAPELAVAYARQIPGAKCPLVVGEMLEKLFPDKSAVRSEIDYQTMEWKAYQNSNICAAYRRSIFDEVGGFGSHIIANEDVLFAAASLNMGYKIAYVSDAVVECPTTPDYEEISRFLFDFAVSVSKHPEVFNEEHIASELKKMMKSASVKIKKNGNKQDKAYLKNANKTFLKYFKKGTKHRKMSYQTILKYSANPDYWRMDELMRERSSVDSRAGYGRSAAEKEMISNKPDKHVFED